MMIMVTSLKTLKRGKDEKAFSHITIIYNGERVLHTYENYNGKTNLINYLYYMCALSSCKKYIGKKVEIVVEQGNKRYSFMAKLHPVLKKPMNDLAMAVAIIQKGYKINKHESDSGISVNFDTVKDAFDFVFNKQSLT